MEKYMEELEELEELNYNLDLTKTTTYINHYYDIKKALIDKQDLEKFTKLIIDKRVNIILVKNSHSAKEYNKALKEMWKNNRPTSNKELIQDEFDFIKKVIVKYGQRI